MQLQFFFFFWQTKVIHAYFISYKTSTTANYKCLNDLKYLSDAQIFRQSGIFITTQNKSMLPLSDLKCLAIETLRGFIVSLFIKEICIL